MNKVIVTGASGLLGRAIVAEFEQNAWSVLKLAHARDVSGMTKIDFEKIDEVNNVVRGFGPNVIIHRTTKNSVRRVQRDYDASRHLNVSSSKLMAQLASELNAVFIFISTDNVFDGTNPPYAETDEPHPINRYGEIMLEAENEVMSINPNSIILRCPLLYGDDAFVGESEVSALINNIEKETQNHVSNYEIFYPSHTYDIARVTFRLCEKKLQDPSLNSVFHWSGEEGFTKHEMVKVISREFYCSSEHVKPYDHPYERNGIRIPRDPKLSCKRLDQLGIGCNTRFHNGIRDFEDFMDEDYVGVEQFNLPFHLGN